MSSEEAYIRKRKRQAKRLSFLFRLMRIFPVNGNKVVFSTFEGDGGFCCNPRYIAEELHKRNSECKMVWLTHDPKKEFPDYILPVKDTKLNLAYHLSTSKVWVDNYRKSYGTLKRKGQLYIQTWHASMGFKAVGLYRGELFPKIARMVSEWDSSLIDYVISNSEYCDQIYPKKLLYTGPTLRTGSPRVDCMINDRDKLCRSIRERYGLSREEKLLLYAPTFRGGNQKGKKEVKADLPELDLKRTVNSLVGKFGGAWTVLLRLHPQLAAKMNQMPKERDYERIIDVSQEPDMSQILGGCDVLITDYSSCAFDAMYAGIPVFLYADDIKEYIENRGQFMWKREELPFLISETNEELKNAIDCYEDDSYITTIQQFMKEYDIIEDGSASERVVNKIEEFLCNRR